MTDELVTHERVTATPPARRYAIAWGVVALGLVTIVAMAAHGAAWNHDRGGELRSLPHGVMVTAAVVAFGLAIVLILLAFSRAGVPETAEQRRRRWMIAIALLALLAAISTLRGFVHPSDPAPRESAPRGAPNGRNPTSASDRDGSSPTTWWPLVIVSLGTAAALFVATARRSRSTAADVTTDAATIALLDASLDDLRREPDARRAVIAAYARMEGGLSARGFARHAAETPTEYLQRAHDVGTDGSLTLPPVAVRALGELTALAERARFSPLAIDETMRTRAIDALERLRDELRVAVEAEREPHSAFDRVG